MIRKFCSSGGQKTSAGCGCKGASEDPNKEGCGSKMSSEHDDDTDEFEKSAYVKAVKELRAIANKANYNKNASLSLRKIAMELEGIL